MKLTGLLKHLFIPHDKNDYKPHFFRELSVGILLFVSTFLLGASYGSSFFIHKTVLGASVAASVLVDLTNDSRLAYNEEPLTRNSKLDAAAQMKGEDMARLGYFAHESPAGITPWYWFKQVGYNFLYAGENLAINYTESVDVEKAWLASPLHRANLLNVKFHEIGIATVEGNYQNNPTIFVVQMFGTPAYSAQEESAKEVVSSTTSNKLAVASKEIATSTSPVILVPGKVKGEATGTSPIFQSLVTTKELAIVKNNSSVDLPTAIITPPEKYSTWYGRFLFVWPRYLDIIYKGLIILVAFALATMLLVEVKKQHYKHVLYGASLLIVLTLLVVINQGFF